MIGARRKHPARLLSIAVALGLLVSCGQQPKRVDHADSSANSPQAEIAEVRANVAAMKESADRGPAIHVDPYVHSKGMMHMAGMQMPHPVAKPFNAR
jgi:hypothetical protein